MPLLDIFRRHRHGPEEAAATAPPAATGEMLDGYTEDWHLRGRVPIVGRLLDALNRREPLAIEDVAWAPVDGSSGFEPVPGLRTVDPYDLVVVLAGPGTMPPRTPDESVAHRRVKEAFHVDLELPPFHVAGTVHLFPGTEPAQLIERAPDLFFAVTDARAFFGETPIGPPEEATILANRSYLTRVEQYDPGPAAAGRGAAADAEAETRA